MKHINPDKSEHRTDALNRIILNILTWNIEGLKRNFLVLLETVKTQNISLVFLNETQIFQSDISLYSQYLNGFLCYEASSEDLYDLDLPLFKRKVNGGTLVFWD